MPMKDTELAYLAGLIDGEGSICISFRRWKKYGEVQTRASLVVYNTDLRMLTWIKERAGGMIYAINRKGSPDWRPSGHWRASELQAELLIEKLMPFLVIKKDQALVYLEFQKTKLSASAGRKLGVPKAMLEKRLELMKQLKHLNEKGYVRCLP